MAARTSQQLEQEIAAMEGRLATAKVTIEVEQDAWKKIARKGKRGTKWKGAATPFTASGKLTTGSTTSSSKISQADSGVMTSRSEVENSDGEIILAPIHWDSLELAQYLQSKELTTYAHVVISEQITGKLLLDTPPGKLKNVFHDPMSAGGGSSNGSAAAGAATSTTGKRDPSWKSFLRICSELHQRQQAMEAGKTIGNEDAADHASGPHKTHHKNQSQYPRASGSPPKTKSTAVSPAMSPRLPLLTTSAMATKAAPTLDDAKQQPFIVAHIGGSGSGGEPTMGRLKTPLPRKPGGGAPSSNAPHMATCWNCGARFPRVVPAASSKADRGRTSGGTGFKPVQAMRLFCSRPCQVAIEGSDMSVSSSLSMGSSSSSYHHSGSSSQSSQPPTLGVTPKPPPGGAMAAKHSTASTRHQNHQTAASPSTAATVEFLYYQAARRGPGPQLDLHEQRDELRQPIAAHLTNKQPPTATTTATAGASAVQRKRFVSPPPPHQHHQSSGASITAVRVLPDIAMPPLVVHGGGGSGSGKDTTTRLQSRVFQQCKYKLDPELFHANGITWSKCFDATTTAPRAAALGSPLSSTSSASSPTNSLAAIQNHHRLVNLETLVGFLSTKAVFHLSLTCHKWAELIHLHPQTTDCVWNVLLHRTWLKDPENADQLRQQGLVSSTKKPRRVMMKMTKQVQKIVLDDLKTLLDAENWQLAPICSEENDYIPISRYGAAPGRSRSHGHDRQEDADEEEAEAVDRGNDLYENITVICNSSCEIVAIRAQELIRPLAEDGSTMEILDGLKMGLLMRVECRRLRLFSLVNKLPFAEWYLLPDVLVVVEFCDAVSPSSQSFASQKLSIWQLTVLQKVQKQLTKRLLGKESVQQIMKWMHERSGSQEAMDALEQFLVRLAPALIGGSSTASSSSARPRR